MKTGNGIAQLHEEELGELIKRHLVDACLIAKSAARRNEDGMPDIFTDVSQRPWYLRACEEASKRLNHTAKMHLSTP